MYTKTIIIAALCLSVGSAFGMHESRSFINADDVHGLGITGLGVTVAVIDSGIYYDHPGLAGSIAPGGVSRIFDETISDGGEDIWGIGHGTYMSLIITDPWGVAPNAKILPVRIANEQDMIWAIDYVRMLRATSNPSIRVINLSLGFDYGQYWYPCQCDDWDPDAEQAISNALNAGIVTFVATGNEAQCGEMSPPACVSSAVKVAANYDQDYQATGFGICGDLDPEPYRVTCFSNIAEECEYLIAAPGYDISVGWFSGDGTSQATAHCSGAAALMFDKNGACGSITADTARSLIYYTASVHEWAYPYCELIPQPRHVNAFAAVSAVTAGPCSAVVGDMDCDETFTPSDFDYFAVCMTGPLADPIGGGCVCADLPASPPDGDMDLRDFINFQRAYSGGSSLTATVTLDITSPSAG